MVILEVYVERLVECHVACMPGGAVHGDTGRVHGSGWLSVMLPVWQEELCMVILEAYVERLIESEQKQLIAHYVSTLPTNLQVTWYAHFLEGESVL